MTDKKKTYGQHIVEHTARNETLDDDVIEYRRAMEPSIISEIERVAFEAKNTDPYTKKDHYYIVFLLKKERIGQAIRPYIFARLSCPTPHWNQTVYKFYKNSDSLEYLWHIPGILRYYSIVNDPKRYLDDKNFKTMAQFVLLDHSGDLLHWVKKENGELKDALITINKENTECQTH